MDQLNKCKMLISSICVVLMLYGCGSVEVGVLPSPTPTPSTLRFEETEYGFAFDYPSNWQVETQPHRVTVSKGTLTLTIDYKGVDEAMMIARPPGIPTDGAISLGKLLFLERAMPSEGALYDMKLKLVIYHEPKPESSEDLIFGINLTDTAGDASMEAYEQIDIQDADITVANGILESMERIPAQRVVAPTPEEEVIATSTPVSLTGPTPEQTATAVPELVLGDTKIRETDEMVMVYVPAGDFLMGSAEEDVQAAIAVCELLSPCVDDCTSCVNLDIEQEQPQHQVTLDAFWIDRTEVSTAQYNLCVDAGVCTEPPEARWFKPITVTPDLPAMVVFDTDMAVYCEWVGGRLPTEAEWEYAARGPDGNLFPWGNTFDPERLNYCDAQCDAAFPPPDPMYPESWADMAHDDGYTYPAPVGSFPEGASWCGALDMAGNVTELVSDWRGWYTIEPKVNPTGPSGEGEFQIIRGGSWNSQPYFTRSTYRTVIRIGGASVMEGFRCVVPID